MYDIFYINSVKDKNYNLIKDRFFTLKFASSIQEAQKKSTTKFFYTVYPDTNIVSSFNFDYIPDGYSQDIPHVFLNDNYYDGIALIPKNYPISDKEAEFRFFVGKKELDIVASNPKKYDYFDVDTWEDYQNALENATTELFFAGSKNIKLCKNQEWNIYFSYHDQYNRKENHVFIHQVENETWYNGLFLLSKHKLVTKKEIEYRHLVTRKEWDIVGSYPVLYDVIFISYNEPNADKNYEDLLKIVPYAKRVHGVKGIHQAHIAAATKSDTDMFFVVDGDARILDSFNFNYQIPKWNQDQVFVWRSINPLNDLVYGYGGVKLLPKDLTINMDTSKPDMTTSIGNKFKAMPNISNITAFNTDPFNTWKSAFRECCKLSSKVIDRQKSKETEERLDIWCTTGKDKPYGEYAIAAAIAGRDYGYKNKDDIEALKKINDFDWLKEQFEKYRMA